MTAAPREVIEKRGDRVEIGCAVRRERRHRHGVDPGEAMERRGHGRMPGGLAARARLPWGEGLPFRTHHGCILT